MHYVTVFCECTEQISEETENDMKGNPQNYAETSAAKAHLKGQGVGT